MLQNVLDPASQLNEAVSDITARFAFERKMSVVGRSDFGEDSVLSDAVDVDINNGVIVTTHGYFRLARHKETGAVCLIASKSSANLQGLRQKDGSIEPTRLGLQKSYIVSAYKTSGDNDDVYRVVPKLRRALRRFGEDLGERSDKHFTLYGASVSDADPNSKDFDASTPTEIYTNGQVAYVIDKTDTGYEIKHYAPTRREDGGFVPVAMGQKSLRDKFASVSKTVAKTETYAEARQKLAEHWQVMSSKLWDQKSIYKGEGVLFNAKVAGAKIFNHIIDNGANLAATSTAVGLTMAAFNPKYGVITGLAGAFLHTAMHLAAEEGYGETLEAWKKARDAKQRLNIDAYERDQDTSDHFKVQTRENIQKLCAKIDMNRFEADEFEFLDAETSGMLLDHQKTKDGFRPSSLRSHLLSAHQRGFSSTCTLPDERTRVDVFQSGLTRFMHEEPNGNVVMYCCYRPDVTLAENLRLPEDKRIRLGHEIIRLDYNKRRDEFYNAFEQFPRPVSLEEMMGHVEELMFDGQDDTDESVKRKSIQSIQETFYLPEQEACNDSFMSRKPAVPPELIAA